MTEQLCVLSIVRIRVLIGDTARPTNLNASELVLDVGIIGELVDSIFENVELVCSNGEKRDVDAL
jgi:hypothetical protein